MEKNTKPFETRRMVNIHLHNDTAEALDVNIGANKTKIKNGRHSAAVLCRSIFERFNEDPEKTLKYLKLK